MFYCIEWGVISRIKVVQLSTDTVFNLWLEDPQLAEFTDGDLRRGAAVLKVGSTDF